MTMATKTRKARKAETVEETVARWYAGAVQRFGYDKLIAAGWEAGQAGHLTIDGVHYERFDVAGGYVVVEWDDEGNVSVS